MKRLFQLAIFFFLFSSCAVHYGDISNSAAVTNNDFRIMDIAVGSAETKHVFGIGGLNKNALVLEAKRDMYRDYPLEPGQMYANVTVDYKRSFYFIVVTTLATVSADIIQFNPSDEQKEKDLFSREAPTQTGENPGMKDHTSAFQVGETVGVFTSGELKTMEVLTKDGKNRYELMNSDSSKFIFQSKNIYHLERLNQEFEHGYAVGDLIHWEIGDNLKSGMILGVNEKMIVAKDEDSEVELSPKEIVPIEKN